MAKLFCLIPIQAGKPNFDFNQYPFTGFVLCGQVGDNGAYIISGSKTELATIGALANVVPLGTVREKSPIPILNEKGEPLLTEGAVPIETEVTVSFAELDQTVDAIKLTKMNDWLTAHSYSTIPADWINRQVFVDVFRNLTPDFDFTQFGVRDSDMD